MEQLDRKKTIQTLLLLGTSMRLWGENQPESAFHPFVAGSYFERMNAIIEREQHHNGWFTPETVRYSFLQWGRSLTDDQLEQWLEPYDVAKRPEKVGIIMAGNIPLVGFHDFLSVLLSGHLPKIKLSRDDDRLLPNIIDLLIELQPELKARVEFVDRLNDIDAVIATGSNNTARYFEKYFGHLPCIIRKNRTSLAVLTGSETTEELSQLGKDIFQYHGLGCRNVSHLMIPETFDLNELFGAIVDYGSIIHHHKYANNYDYYKAIYLMNQEAIVENGFVLMRPSSQLFAPIGVLHFQRYEAMETVQEYIEAHEDELQVVVGRDYTPFGKAQEPALEDYADDIDTLAFLQDLN
ncbi:MAG: acyl-CoA reductase [Bacteroidota bacterium]